MENKPEKKKKSLVARILLSALIVLLTLILIFVGIIGFAIMDFRNTGKIPSYVPKFLIDWVIEMGVDKMYDKIEFIEDDGHTISPGEAESIVQGEHVEILPDNTDPIFDQEDIVFQPEDTEHEGQGDHVVNVLLVGQDAREGEGRQRSDSMILITLNKHSKAVTLTSFMRDQYVQIPGYGATKLCHAYQYGGMNLLNQTLYNHYGIEIDGNLEVNFTGFEKIIDLLGGVEIDLTKKEVKYLKSKGYKTVKEGMNLLDGEVALLYSRLRSIDTDYNRAERQRNVLMSLIEKYKDQSYSQMLSLMEELLPLMKTNMTQDKITDIAQEYYSMIAGAEIETQRIPVDGTFKGGFVRVSEGLNLWCQLNIDFEANREILNKIFE